MNDKWIRVNEQLHRRVKLSATMHGVSIKDYVERVLENALAAEGMTLVDPGIDYETHPNSIGAEFGPAGESCPD